MEAWGGWESFGPLRRITKSKDNVLLELDGKSALELYKWHLGDQLKGIPGTGLLFPLMVQWEGQKARRTDDSGR